MNLKLGKKPAEFDPRTVRLSAFWRKVPSVPNAFDFDRANCPSLMTPMFANDRLGCCVISARAHMTLRFEVLEQARVIHIGDEDVVKTYLKESNGVDSGLVMLDSLKCWRNEGWTLDSKPYDIWAFGAVNPYHQQDVMVSVVYLGGCYTGVMLPSPAQQEFSDGKPWSDISGYPGGWGGHAMLMTAYDEEGVTFITWGKKQKATWDWFLRYTDEAYAVIDSRDKFLGDQSPLDIATLEEYLQFVTT